LCLHGRCVEVPDYDFFNTDHRYREVTRSSITRCGLKFCTQSFPSSIRASRDPSGGLCGCHSGGADRSACSRPLFLCGRQVAWRSDRLSGLCAAEMTSSLTPEGRRLMTSRLGIYTRPASDGSGMRPSVRSNSTA
jgi:hypothetical protein